MNKKGIKVTLIVLTAILVIESIYLIFCFIKPKDDVLPEEEVTEVADASEAEVDNSRDLTEKELKSFQNYLMQKDTNDFLVETYDDIRTVDLSLLIYDYGEELTSDEEKSDYLAATNQEQIETTVLVRKTKETNEFLKLKTGYQISDFKENNIGKYIEKYDSYYAQHGDTRNRNLEVVSGQFKNGKYLLNYKIDETTYQVTLRKDYDHFIFETNKCIEKCTNN